MLLTCIPMTDYFAKYTAADAYFYQTGQNKIKFVFVYCHFQVEIEEKELNSKFHSQSWVN